MQKIQFQGLQIAHRGFHTKEIPENSIAAFQNAIKYHYPIELDVHLTKDQQVVVFHDDHLKRMTGIDRFIKDCTYAELQTYSLNGTNEKIPLLKDVLRWVGGQVLLNIEIKYDVKAKNIGPYVAKELDYYNGPFLIQSFDPRILMWFKKHCPNYMRGILVSSYYQQKKNFIDCLLQKMFFNFMIQPDFISYDVRGLPNPKVDLLRKKGIPVLTWTVRTEQEAAIAKKYADGMIFELEMPK